MKGLLATLFPAAAVLLAATLGTSPATTTGPGAAGPATAGHAELGSAAPALPVTLLSGNALPGPVTAGKVTVLNFWATWCPPCRAETAGLVAAYRSLKAPDVAFLGIDTTETAPIVRTFLSAKGVPYPVALAGPALYNAYGIAYIPTTIVVDGHGIVRARWIGGVAPAQLAKYVADARAGRTSLYVSPLQARIDALLDPSRYPLSGTRSERAASEQKIAAALASTDGLVAKAGAGSAVDFERTQREEGALRVAAGTSERDDAGTRSQKLAALALLAAGQGDLNRWDAAAATERAALALAPSDPKTVAALARAYYRLHDYDAMIVQARRYTELAPADGDGWSELGLGYQRAKRFGDAAPAYEKSLTLLVADAARHPKQDALADVADTSLDAANVYVALGDAAGARRAFARANAYGDRLDPKGSYADLQRNVRERTQEGLVAVALAGKRDKTYVSIAPWSGPDLPGSLASTLKYRLIVAAPAGTPVRLRAQGLLPKWIASFCAAGLCSPQTVSLTSPESGVTTYEFQLVPPRPGADPGHVWISYGAHGSEVQVGLRGP